MYPDVVSLAKIFRLMDHETIRRRNETGDDVRQAARAIRDIACFFEHGDVEIGRCARACIAAASPAATPPMIRRCSLLKRLTAFMRMERQEREQDYFKEGRKVKRKLAQ
jgi:hypothetical protein